MLDRIMFLQNTARRFSWPAAALALLLAALFSGPLAALAQPYEALPYKKLSGSRSTVQRILRGDTPLAGSEERFDNFFTQYVFAEMAPSDPQKLGGIGNARVKFRNQYLGARSFKDPAARERLNRLAMDTMKQLVEGNYHPGVRTNAVLTIAMLNREPAVESSGASRRPPVPLKEASDYLLSLLDEANRPGDASLKDALLMNTLVGLVRHGKYGLDDQQRALLTPKMLAIVTQKEPPSGRLPEVHVWFRTGAADVLAAMGDPGSGNEVVGALQALFIEDGASNEQRCWAALALGQLKYDATTKAIASELVGQLGDFAVLACHEEMEIGARNIMGGGTSGRRQRFTGGPMGMMGGPMMGLPGRGADKKRGTGGRNARNRGNRAGPGDRDKPKVEVETVFPRRELAYRLICARDALRAVQSGADDTHNILAEQLQKQIATARKVLEDQYKEDVALIDPLYEACQAMESALSGARAATNELPDAASEDAEADEEDDVFADG